MQELFDELKISQDKRLILMPLTRLVFDFPFKIGKFHFFPPENIEVGSLRPIPNKTFDREVNKSSVTMFQGQYLRESSTSLTGFDVGILNSHPLVAFVEEIDWDDFLGQDHKEDINLIKKLSSKAERAIDIIRFEFCRFDLPDTLPGPVGSWESSGCYLGALLYSIEDHESYLIAGDAVECSIVIKGLGLEINGQPLTHIPNPSEGELAGIALHGLFLFSDAANSSNETIKFIRIMTLLEFLASPDEYQSWKKLKGNIACHCAKDAVDYHSILERFMTLTSKKDSEGQEIGIRTLLVHQGKLIPELIPNPEERKSLFKELQRYCGMVINDMIKESSMSWVQFCNYRDRLKQEIGIKKIA